MSQLVPLQAPGQSFKSQLLCFSSGGQRYACDLLWVKEVLRSPVVTPVRLAPDYVRGVVHLRGHILTALDLEVRLGLPRGDSAASNRCIVFKTSADLLRLSNPPQDCEAADSDPIGVLVDAIGDILPPETSVLPAPPEALSGLDSRFIAGVISDGGELVMVLRVGALVSIVENRKPQAE
ncbi:MAG: chemotaxis protein CheW [Verrucomicrobiota bacterium]